VCARLACREGSAGLSSVHAGFVRLFSLVLVEVQIASSLAPELSYPSAPMTSGDTSPSPAIFAAADGQLDQLIQALDAGAAIDAVGYRANSALMIAANNGHAEVVSALLRRGANPNLQNVRGETALMLAAGGGYTDIASLLIEAGADTLVENWWGETARAIAERNNKRALVELLLNRHSTKVNRDEPSRLGDLLVRGGNRLEPASGTLCWFCEKVAHKLDASPKVDLYAPMTSHGGGSDEWSKLSVTVPMCGNCKRLAVRRSVYAQVGLFVGISALVPGFALWEQLKWGFSGFLLSMAFMFVGMVAGLMTGDALGRRAEERAGIKDTEKPQDHPVVQLLADDNWVVRKEPPKVASQESANSAKSSVSSARADKPNPSAPAVPAPTISQRFSCARCGRFLDGVHFGAVITCPACQGTIRIPESQACHYCGSGNVRICRPNARGSGAAAGALMYGPVGLLAGGLMDAAKRGLLVDDSPEEAYECSACRKRWAYRYYPTADDAPAQTQGKLLAKTCAHCGAKIPSTDELCPSCGKRT
jgi:uncharacterized protein